MLLILTASHFVLMYAVEGAMKQLKESVALGSLQEQYAAYYLPGGHGTVVDFPQSVKLQQLLGAAWDNGMYETPNEG